MKVISKHNNLHNGVGTNQSSEQRKKTQNFGNGAGMVTALGKGLQVLDANPMAAVTFLDVSTAIGPNTIIDAKERNPVQAFETFRRESSGLLINCLLPGGAALVVGRLMKARQLGKEFGGIKAHRIWAGKDTINESTEQWKKLKGSKKENVNQFIKDAFSIEKVQVNEKSALGLNRKDKEALKKLDDVTKKISQAVIKAEKGDTKIPDKLLKEAHKDFTEIYGNSKSLKVKTLDGKHLETGLKNYIRDNFALAKAFSHEKVTADNIDKFSNGLKKMVSKKSAITMVGVGALALAMQKINRKITEKTSGQKGYQGYADNSVYVAPTKEEKRKLWGSKGLAVAWMGALAAGAIGKVGGNTFNFVGPQTTINQARSFALLTNTGRIAAAEDKNELKDTVLRDTMIFLNLYVLGDYVQKGVVGAVQKRYKKNHKIDLNLMNEGKPASELKTPFAKFTNWLRGKSVKSFDEIEGTAKALPKELDGKNLTKLRKNIVTVANVSGIAYSLVALGIAMPLLIAKMTQKNRQKQLEQLKLQGRNHDTNVSMAGGFSNEKTNQLFKAFKS